MQRARQLAEEFAEDLAKRGGATPIGPIDVKAIAAHLGLTIFPDDIPQDGRFVPGPQPAIIVRRGQLAGRERFTIAHELVHWAVAYGGTPAAEASDAFVSEEMLCNTVAAALLMPKEWMHDEFSDAFEDQSIETVMRVATQARVSLGAAVIRLRDLFGWNKTLLHWSRVDGEWLFDGEAGVYPWEQGAIMPSSNALFVLNDVRNSGLGIQLRALPMRIFRVEQEVAAEVLPLRRGAAVLVDTPAKQ